MIGLFAVMLAATASAPAEPRLPVDVVSPETSEVSLQLSDALLKALDSAARLRASTGDEEPELKLAILGASTPSAARLKYLVDLIDTRGVTPHRLASLEGTCQTDALAQCAAGIVEKAQRKVKD